MSSKRRLTLILTSITVGTALAWLLMLGRKGKLDSGDYGTLFVNSLLALAVVFGVGYIFKKQKGSDQ